MGILLNEHGPFTIEERRESFYIHASYGLEPRTEQLDTIRVGRLFKKTIDGPPFQVVGQLMDCVLVKRADRVQPGEGDRFDRRLIVIPIEGEDRGYSPIDSQENDHPLGRIWREHPHPEIELKDLDHLIAALQELKERQS